MLTGRRINSVAVSPCSADTKNLRIENAAGLWADENAVPSLHNRALLTFE